jgi:hypothetical protein
MTVPETEKLFCYNHPKKETHLRCNKCERPICNSCAVRTPTGYRCKECVRGQQKIFDTARWWDYPLAVVVAFVLAMIGSLLINALGYFTILAAPFAGIAIAEAVRFVVRRRRSRNLPIITAASSLIGAMALKIPIMVFLFNTSSQMTTTALFSLLWPGIFAVIAASTVFYRLKGIRL